MMAWIAVGVSAEEAASLKLPSDGVALWNAAMEAYADKNYIDALQKLKWYQRQVEGGDEEWHPHLVSFLRIRCAVNLGHFEKVHEKLDALDLDELPAPLRHQAQVLRWHRRLSEENHSAPLPDPIEESVSAPMAEARLASVQGRVLESEGDTEGALESYAKSIVLAPPEDQEETLHAMERITELLTVSGQGEEAVQMMKVQSALYSRKEAPTP
jgi:hypothetical protein